MSDYSEIFGTVSDTKSDRMTPVQMQAYINMLRADNETLRAQEREACARICDEAKAKSRNALVRSAFTIAAGEIRSRT